MSSSMQRIILASTNPVKARATLAGFQEMFPDDTFHMTTLSIASSVRPQPLSSAEALQGACTRAQRALWTMPAAHYGVGIEGGVEEQDGEMLAFAWVVIVSQDQLLGKARTGTFLLPEAVATLVRQGKELGEADDIVFGRENSKQEQGAVGLLTDGVLDRAQLYAQAVVLALIPFRHRTLYNISTSPAKEPQE